MQCRFVNFYVESNLFRQSEDRGTNFVPRLLTIQKVNICYNFCFHILVNIVDIPGLQCYNTAVPINKYRYERRVLLMFKVRR